MRPQIKEIIDDVKTYVEYQKAIGVTELPIGGKMKNERQKTKADQRKVAGNAKDLEAIEASMKDCKKCKLCGGRTNIVFGEGSAGASLMFIGEGPGADEDAQGRPFVGRAGQLLTKIIIAMGMNREEVYIGNIVKCRPPNNRNPEPDEIEACIPRVLQQIDVIKPKIIVALGAIAAKALLKTEVPISKLRGKLLDWPPEDGAGWEGITIEHRCKLIPTYHPAYLLRNPEMKKPVWEDMKIVMKELKVDTQRPPL